MSVAPTDAPKRMNARRSNLLTTSHQVGVFIGTCSSVALKQLDNRDDELDIFHSIVKKSKTMIHPNSNFRRFWDICTALNVVLVCVIMPLHLAFDNYMSPLSWTEGLEAFFDVYFVLDMVLSFRTGFVSSGEVVMDPKHVGLHYLKTWFLIDIVSNFPFSWVMQGTTNPKSVKFLKLQKIPKLLRFTRLLKYMRQYAKYYKFVLTIFVMVLSLHCFTCIWVNVYSICTNDTIDGTCQDGALEIHVIYLQAFMNVIILYMGIDQTFQYKQLTTALFTPQEQSSISSYLLSFGILLLGTATIFLILGNIISIIISWDQQSALFRNRMDIISAEMKHYDLPIELQRRVRKNYDYLWLNQRAYSEMSILKQSGISQPTRTNIALHLYRDLIESVPYFAGEDSKFLGRVCLALKTAVFLPGDLIIQKGDTGREMFFVRRGRVQVEVPDGSIPIRLKDGDFFGETALVVDIRRTNSVRAITICDLNELSKQAFDEILSEFPEFFDKIKRVVIERQLDNMHIRSEKDKAVIKAEITDIVNETAARRVHDTSSPYWHVLNARKVGNKLKGISERVRAAQERNPRMKSVIYRSKGKLRRSSAKKDTTKRSIASPASIRKLLESIDMSKEETIHEINEEIPSELKPDTEQETMTMKTDTSELGNKSTEALEEITSNFDKDSPLSIDYLSHRLSVLEKSTVFLPMFVKAFEDAMKNVSMDLNTLRDAMNESKKAA